MPRVVFTPNLRRHIDCPPVDVAGATVGEVLASAFTGNPRLKSYILDEQGAVRKHVAIFISGELIRDREKLSDPVPAAAEVFVMQALSGGSGSFRS